MHHRPRSFVTGTAMLSAAALLGGCGAAASAPHGGPGGAATKGGAVGSGPPQAAEAVLLSSVQRTTSQSFQADLSMDLAMTSGAGAGSTPPFGAPTSVHMVMHVGVRNPQQSQVTMTLNVPGRQIKAQAVLDNGVLYLSSNGGSSWTQQAAGAANLQYGPDMALQFMKAVGQVRDDGPGTADGLTVEKYEATLDAAKLEAAAGSVFSALGGGAGTAVHQLMHSLNGVMRAAIDTAGRLVTEDCTATMTLDLPAFGGSSAKASSLGIQETVHGHFYDYGGDITVQPPPSGRVHAAPAPGLGSAQTFSSVSPSLG